MDAEIQKEIDNIIQTFEAAQSAGVGVAALSDNGVSKRVWALYNRRFSGKPICVPTVEEATRRSYLLDVPGFQAALSIVASFAKSNGTPMDDLAAKIDQVLEADREAETSPLWMSLHHSPDPDTLKSLEIKFVLIALPFLGADEWDGDLQDIENEMRRLNAELFPDDQLSELVSKRLNDLKRIFAEMTARGLIEMQDAEEMVRVTLEFAVRCGNESGRQTEVTDAILEIENHPDVKCSSCSHRCMPFADGGVFEALMAGKRTTALMDKVMYALHLMTIPVLGVNSAKVSSDTVDELFCSIRGIIQDASERTGVPIHDEHKGDNEKS